MGFLHTPSRCSSWAQEGVYEHKGPRSTPQKIGQSLIREPPKKGYPIFGENPHRTFRVDGFGEPTLCPKP